MRTPEDDAALARLGLDVAVQALQRAWTVLGCMLAIAFALLVVGAWLAWAGARGHGLPGVFAWLGAAWILAFAVSVLLKVRAVVKEIAFWKKNKLHYEGVIYGEKCH